MPGNLLRYYSDGPIETNKIICAWIFKSMHLLSLSMYIHIYIYIYIYTYIHIYNIPSVSVMPFISGSESDSGKS